MDRSLAALCFFLSALTGGVILALGLTDLHEALLLIPAAFVVPLVGLVLGMNLPGLVADADFEDRPDGFVLTWSQRLPQERLVAVLAATAVGWAAPSLFLLSLLEAFGFGALGAMMSVGWGGALYWGLHRRRQYALDLRGRVLRLGQQSVVLESPDQLLRDEDGLWVKGVGATLHVSAPRSVIAPLEHRLLSLPSRLGDAADVPAALSQLREPPQGEAP